MASCLVTPSRSLRWSVSHSILTCLRSWFLVLSVERSFSGDFFPLNGATWKDVFLLSTCHTPAGYSFSHSGSLRPRAWGLPEALGSCRPLLRRAGGSPEEVWSQGDPHSAMRSGQPCKEQRPVSAAHPWVPAHGKEQGHRDCDDGAVWTVPRETQPRRGTHTGVPGVFWDCIGGKERNFLKAIDLAWRTYQENVGFGRRLMMIGLNFSLRELLTKFEKVW